MANYLKVEESFVGKLGTTQDYAWLYEEIDHIENLSDDDIREYVDTQASIIYDMYDGDCTNADREPLSFEDWKAASDYEDAVQAVMDARDKKRDELVRHPHQINLFVSKDQWQAVHQAVRDIPHYWEDEALYVDPIRVGDAVRALNAIGIETDEDDAADPSVM